MGAVGIVAEYNPFHSGHLYQLRRIRREMGEDTPVIAVMSGDFVQRGEAACFSKSARAEAAVRCGVSLVLELPLPWSVSSAEGFARGAVGLLSASGVVEALSFGSESGDPDRLRACAEVLGDARFPEVLRSALAEGIPFAAARDRAAAELAGEETALALRSPNDLLAVEYLRAAERIGFSPALLCVRRTGSRHDGPGSASWLRQRMETDDSWLDELPADAAEVFRREIDAGRGPVTAAAMSLPLVSRLRERTLADFAALPDAAEGLENSLYAAARRETTPEAMARSVKSKRYALSRLRRMLLCAALGIKAGDAAGSPPYLRVLAADERGTALLRQMRSRAALPVIVKPARADRLEAGAREIFELNSRAHDLYVLGAPAAENRRGGEDWRTTPFIRGES